MSTTTATTIDELIRQGLVDGSRDYSGRPDHHSSYRALATTDGHKVHRTTVTRYSESGNVSVDSPWCGSDRHATRRIHANVRLVPLTHGITCGRCLRVYAHEAGK